MQRGTAIGAGIIASMDAIALGGLGTPSSNNTSNSQNDPPTLEEVPPGTIIPAIVVLLTDGQNRNGIDPIEAAEMAAQRGVRVYTVGIGSREGGFMPQGFGGGGGSFGGGFGGGGRRQELDEETLKAIASSTGGEYFYAADETELDKIYGNLGLNLVLKLEKVELTAWFTAAAALILFAAVGLSLLWSTFG
jgi:Ca-activated chloride channel family protein